MSKEQHTPLKVGNHFKSAVLNSENKMIADCKTPEIAKLIVKACNNHDRLVEALEWITNSEDHNDLHNAIDKSIELLTELKS